MHPPKGCYYADPFGFLIHDHLHLLVEAYSYNIHKGNITKFILEKDQKILNQEIILNTDIHFSYPFIFLADNNVYCIPETASTGKVMLFQFNTDTGNFEYLKTILDNFPAVDPSIIFYKNKYWLFLSNQRNSNSSLFIFYADDLKSTFIPHSQNPVKNDIRSSRPAGTLFITGDKLYRPSQDSSKTYGGGISVNLITTLTEDSFKEEIGYQIIPDEHSRYNKGLHTLSSAGEYTLIDGKYFTFVWDHFILKFKQKILRISSGR